MSISAQAGPVRPPLADQIHPPKRYVFHPFDTAGGDEIKKFSVLRRARASDSPYGSSPPPEAFVDQGFCTPDYRCDGCGGQCTHNPALQRREWSKAALKLEVVEIWGDVCRTAGTSSHSTQERLSLCQDTERKRHRSQTAHKAALISQLQSEIPRLEGKPCDVEAERDSLKVKVAREMDNARKIAELAMEDSREKPTSAPAPAVAVLKAAASMFVNKPRSGLSRAASGFPLPDKPHPPSAPPPASSSSDAAAAAVDSFGSAEVAQTSPAGGDDLPDASTTCGQTPFLPLREHSMWCKCPSTRDTQRLLPHPVTLKGVQRVLHGDTDAPAEPPASRSSSSTSRNTPTVSEDNVNVPRKGTVTRRYLLCDSKTNATLRLSIRVEPVPFPSSFLPPFVALPLPHNEILAGVGAAILLSTRAEVYRTCPHAFDLYPPPGRRQRRDAPVRPPMAIPTDKKRERSSTDKKMAPPPSAPRSRRRYALGAE
ncbi:hypothetical protein B0H12DRAFT_1276335 [Mycena haematopus]|nr:hypothetical protein B0H12DRAFT_1276335 [Mycena haematopus]